MTKRSIIGILLLVLVIFFTCVAVDFLSNRESSTELSLVKDAVRNAAVTCYAVEGSYPASLSYLQAHYGLQYDANRYLVVYDAFASNLMPDIQVLEREARQ